MSNAAYRAFWSHPPTLERHVGAIVAIYREMLGRGRAAEAA